jgi:hypothetical protein
LPWRIILVGQENRIEAIQNLPDVHFFFFPLLPTPLPKRGYDAVSAVADEVWQYHTGGNLTIFDKDNDTMKDRSRIAEVLAAKHRRLLRLPCTAGGNQAKLNVYRIRNRGRGVEAGQAHVFPFSCSEHRVRGRTKWKVPPPAIGRSSTYHSIRGVPWRCRVNVRVLFPSSKLVLFFEVSSSALLFSHL